MTIVPRPTSRASTCLSAFLSAVVMAACSDGNERIGDDAGGTTSLSSGSSIRVSTTDARGGYTGKTYTDGAGAVTQPNASGGGAATRAAAGASAKHGGGVPSTAADSSVNGGTSGTVAVTATNTQSGNGGAGSNPGSTSAKSTGSIGGSSVTSGSSAAGGARATDGPGSTSSKGGAGGSGTTSSTGGASAASGTAGAWPNIRVVGNRLHDRWGAPFAVRSIESMFGNGTSDPTAFVAGHKALGANTLGPLPNTSVSSPTNIAALLAAAYEAGLVIGLNADHTNQGTAFFRNAQIQTVINRYPNVFLQEAVELGSDMTQSEWLAAAKAKVDAYVDLYPDKPLKLGSPMGGRSPRFALDHCQDVVDYYYSRGGRGGLIFTCQLYWRATTASWSYQEENGFVDGLPGILAAVDAMAASPCMFMPGLDHQDDVGYTGWREVMDHVRASNSEPGLRLSYQWWVYYNEGDPYDNDLTTDADDALSAITSIGKEVKAKLERDREYIELGPLNP